MPLDDVKTKEARYGAIIAESSRRISCLSTSEEMEREEGGGGRREGDQSRKTEASLARGDNENNGARRPSRIFSPLLKRASRARIVIVEKSNGLSGRGIEGRESTRVDEKDGKEREKGEGCWLASESGF